MSDIKLTIQPPAAIKLTIQPPAEVKLALSVGQGPAGPPGAASGTTVEPFNFMTPITTWVVNHNLGRRPLVSVFSVGGLEMFAEVLQVSVNQVTITFDNPTAGYAVVS